MVLVLLPDIGQPLTRYRGSKQGATLMQDTNLLNEGLALMGMGMGFVFVFLTVLVITVTLMSGVVRRFQPAAPAPAVKRSTGSAAAATHQDEEVMAVISAAVHRYRRHKDL